VNVIGTKWMFRNKLNELGNIIRNKARFFAQCHKQVVGIEFDEKFAPVVRLEYITLLLVCAKNFTH
jgi:hypothetical protein